MPLLGLPPGALQTQADWWGRGMQDAKGGDLKDAIPWEQSFSKSPRPSPLNSSPPTPDWEPVVPDLAIKI